MIKHISFKHGWFYHYRIHLGKIDSLCKGDILNLKKYIIDVFDNCPDEPFLKGPRCSKLRDSVNADLKEIDGHEVSQIAKVSHDKQPYSTAHTRVEMQMLQNDTTTLAVELPVWIEENEIDYDIQGPLSGHIDALRVEDGHIWVWDYKPRAHLEKYADTQTFLYALMLSKRANIPLEKFRCGYFDEEKAFIFKPEISMIEKVEGIKK